MASANDPGAAKTRRDSIGAPETVTVQPPDSTGPSLSTDPADRCPVRANPSAAEQPAVPGSLRPRRVWLPAIIGLVAFCCRLVPVLRGGGLLGQDTYDPSVYYAAAVGLFSGRLPYRDFLLLHPPGILLALQPFVALGALVGDPSAVAVARLAFMFLGAASAVLIYRLLLSINPLAALVGAGFYAAFYPALVVERTMRLEGILTFVMLAALILVPIHRAVPRGDWVCGVAGVLLGFGLTVKLWGLVPLAAVVLWLILRRQWRSLFWVAAGSSAVVLVVVAPFLWVARGQMWRMVITDQMVRWRNPVPVDFRVADIVGLGQLESAAVPTQLTWSIAALVLALAVLAAIRSRNLGRFAALLLALTTMALLAGPAWFAHYPAFTAAPLALVLGTAVGSLGSARRPALAARLAALATAVLLSAAAMIQLVQLNGSDFPGPELGRILASRPGCITTDNPQALIMSNTLRRNLARGCPLMVDLGGYIFHLGGGGNDNVSRPRNRAFQKIVIDYLSSGESTIVMRLWPDQQDGLSASTQQQILSWPIVGVAQRFEVRQPVPQP